MSVGLSPTDLTEIVRLANKDATAFGVTIACINSPSNVTISGETHLIDHIKVQLDDQDVFSRKLSVNLAYHSKQMEAVSEKYVTMVGSLSKPESLQQLANVPMISSVTGKSVDASVLIDASYWAKNMVSPVLFSQAVSNMCAKAHVGPKKIDRSHNLVSAIDHLVEIGPHAALQGPITQILRASTRGSSVGYSSILRRGLLATDTMLETLGSLHCKGALLNFKSINEPRGEATRSLVVDLPEYPFDHSQHYWYESRLSRNYRFRSHAPSELLGVRSRDWNPADAKWRHFLRLKEMPWMEQHVVNGKTLYPGSGMLVMALEAAKQVLSDGPNGDKITGYTLRDVHLDAPIDLANAGPEGLEVQTSLRERQASHGNDAASFDFTVRTYANDHWRVNCRGQVHVELSEPTAEGHEDSKLQTEAERRQFRNNVSEAIASCESEVDSSFMYSYLKINKYDYGPHFQAAQHQRCNRQKRQASSQTKLFDTLKEEHLIHPVSLDAILHLSFTALTSGGARPMATSVPSYIASLWISSKGLNSFDNYMAPTQTTINEWTGRGFTCNGAALGGADNEELRLWYDGLQLTNITASPPSLELPSPHQYCMTIETQVALDKLGHSEVQNLLADLHPADDDNVKFWEDTEKIIETCLEKLAASVNLEDVIQDPGAETWKVQYSKWALHHLTRLRLKRGSDSSLPVSETPITELCERIGNSNRVGRLYVTVAETLESLFSRELAPLETLMQTGLLRDYYAELCTYRCMWQAATYLGLLSHQKPGMKILEVGGGTASATRKFLATLAGGSGNADGVGSADKLSSLRCSRYDFTDVSASFLEKARLEFAPYQAQMTFGTLDIERDFAEQGYEDNSYDVIVADGVLHVTYDLKQTLTNARKALKPGGKLIMPELLKSDGWTAGFVFGLFPGWWFATSEDRQLSPNLSASEWDAVLRETGFSGGDVVLTDFDADVAHHLGCIISTAVPFEPVPSAELSTEQRATILFDQTSEKQRLLAEELVEPMRSTLGIEAVLEPTDFETPRQDSRESQSEELIVFLADFGSSSFVANMNETTWTYMKSLVRTSNKLLWVSSGGGTPDASNPDNGVLDGLTRTLRTEFYELHLVLVALDDTGSSTVGRASTHLVQVTQEMLTRESGAGYEQDYMEMGGLLHTRRLVGAGDIKTSMDERLLPYKEVLMNTDEARFQLSTKTFLGTDDDNANWISLPKAEELSREHLEVQIKAVSMLQPHSREGALIASSSPLSHHGGSIGIGNFYAGVVNQIGSGVSSVFQTGDRVFGSRPHDVSLRSHLEVNTSGIARIPPTLSFEEACSLLPPTVLAYHAMVEVSQIKPSHRVLIHSAMTQVGQAALRVLTDRGVTNIWAMTEVGEDEGRAWVSRHLGNTEEDRHIPQNWLSRDSMLLSKWKRHFDVVFVPLGDMNAALTNLVRPGGRYVTLISSPSDKNSLRDLQSLPVDTSLSVIQAQYLAPSEEALRYAVEHLSPAQPAEVSSMGHGGQRQFLGSELVSLIPPVKDSSDNEVKDQVKAS